MRALIFGTLLLFAAHARAQEGAADAGATDDGADIERARSLAREGHQAMVEERWDDAYAALDEAYRLAPLPPILVNLAGAELQTGRVRAAIAHYEAFLRAAAGDPSLVPLRPSAERALETARSRLARVVVTVERRAPEDEVRLDGEALGLDELGSEVIVDPGEHVATLVRGDREVARETASVPPGGRTELVLVPAASTIEPVQSTGPAPTRGPSDEADGGGVLSSPWLWLTVAVLAIGGGIAAYVLTRDASGTPAMPNTMPGVITFD